MSWGQLLCTSSILCLSVVVLIVSHVVCLGVTVLVDALC